MSVLLKIQIESENNFFVLDSEDYHAYLIENEVLMQEGIDFKVKSVEKLPANYFQVHLHYQ